MFEFPPQTRFGKSVPKSRIYLHATLTRRVKDLFVSQLAEIVWAHKLSPETLHLPATPAVPEIQVFDLHLKGAVLDESVLQAIDRAIPFPILHRLHSEEGIAYSAAYKRPSEADSSQWVTGVRFTTDFREEIAPPLPAALDLGHLYAAIFERLLPLSARPGEDLPTHLQRCGEHQRLTRRIDQLTAKLHRENQFNKRVELNQQLKPLLAQAAALSSSSFGPRALARPDSSHRECEPNLHPHLPPMTPNPPFPRDDDKFDEWLTRQQREDEYLDYCEQHDLDPKDECNREEWEENEKERIGHGWDQMDPDDEAGWTDNMNKD